MELIVGICLLLLAALGEIGLYRCYGLKGLSYSCQFAETQAEEGDTLTFTETVVNAKSLPVPWLKAELTLPKWLNFPESHCAVAHDARFVTSFFSLRSQAKVSRVWNVTCEKRGIYQVEHVVLVTSDLLGAVRLSLGAADTGKTVTVLPRRYTEAGLILPRLLAEHMGTIQTRRSWFTDPCEMTGIREYAPGDPLKQIAWRTSAHAGKLLVRQEARVAQKSITVLLLLKTSPADSGRMTQDEALLEHTIRVCAQCLWELCRDQWQVRLVAGCRKEGQSAMQNLPYASGAIGYQAMLHMLATIQTNQAAPATQLLRTGRECAEEQVLLITPYTDVQIREWKGTAGHKVLMTGYARDTGSCADLCVFQPGYEKGDAV